MNADPREVKKALKKKGFEEEKSKHHIYYYFHHKGRRSHISTKVSHGARDIGVRLISAMSRQMRITKGQFLEFVDCELSMQGYLEKLVKNGHLKS